MEILYETAREPKTLHLERSDEGRYRLVITLKKLGMFSAMEYFLDVDEAKRLADALSKLTREGVAS